MKNIIIFFTTSSKAEGRRIARKLVSERLAACVSMIPKVESVYSWKKKIETASEVLLVAKTKASLFSKAEQTIKRLHSYECPEIIAVSIIKGSDDYLRWIDQTTLI